MVMQQTERRGSRPGEKRGDQSPENLARNVLEEQLVECITRAERNVTGDAYERSKIKSALLHASALTADLESLREYQIVEDAHNTGISEAARRAYGASQRLEAALEARTLLTAKGLIRLALEELGALPQPIAAA